MSEIKTDLFPDRLRAARDDQGMGEKGIEENGMRADSMSAPSASMKAEDEYTDTMTPAEPLPETERPRKDGPGGA